MKWISYTCLRSSALLWVAVVATLIGGMALCAPAAHGQTVAYYRFENGSNNQTATTPITDQTGQNPLAVESGSDAHYSSTVPFSTVPQTGAANTLSMNFTSLAALQSQSSQTTFNQFNFSAWTIEASVNFKALTGFQTFVGKDGAGTGGDLYFQRNGRNNGFSILYTGTNGQQQGFDSSFIPQANTWYNVAAVYNGTSIALYVNDTLVQSAPALGLIVDNTQWSVGRGWFNGPADGSDALVDEVRFSNTALAPNHLLAASALSAVPEPGYLGLLAGFCFAGLSLFARRRRKSSVAL